jgi:hypothetical protein
MQQLQNAGVPQHVVDIASAVAKQLSAQAASAATSSWAASSEDYVFLLSPDVIYALRMLERALLQREGSSLPAGSASAVAGSELALAVLGFARGLLQPGPQQQTAPWAPDQGSLWSAVDTALKHLTHLLASYQHLKGPAVQLALPSATRTCGVLAVLSQYSDCLKGLSLSAVRDAGTGSGSQSSDSGTTPAAAAAAAEASVTIQGASDEWVLQVASTNVQHLPDVAPALAKCIGLSKLQLACIAAHMLRSDSTVDMGRTYCSWGVVVSSAMNADAEERQQQQQGRQPFKVVEGLSQLELTSLLLEWVAALDSDVLFSGTCTGAILAISVLLRAFTARYKRQQQQGAAEADWQLMRLLESWANSTVPVLVQVMRKMLCRAQAVAAAAVTGAPDGRAAISSSSSSSSSSSGVRDGVGSLDELQTLHKALSLCVKLLAELDVVTVVWARGCADNPAWGPGCCRLSLAWDSCGVEVVSVLEGYVRLLLSVGSTAHPTPDLAVAVGTWTHMGDLLCQAVPHCIDRRSLLLVLGMRASSDGQQHQHQSLYLRGFMSLLVSALKLAGSSCVQEAPREGVGFCLAAAIACADMLTVSAARLGRLAAEDSSGASPVQQQVAAAAIACLPWLVLLGRVCYHAGGSLMTVLGQPSGRNPADTLRSVLGSLEEVFQGLSSKLELVTGAPQLAAAGYALQSVREQFGLSGRRYGTQAHACPVTLMQLSLHIWWLSLCSSCVRLGLLPAASLCLTSATTQVVRLRVGSRRLSWCWGAAACVAGAVWRTTAAGIVSVCIGRSTSQRAGPWQQQQQQQLQVVVTEGRLCAHGVAWRAARPQGSCTVQLSVAPVTACTERLSSIENTIQQQQHTIIVLEAAAAAVKRRGICNCAPRWTIRLYQGVQKHI